MMRSRFISLLLLAGLLLLVLHLSRKPGKVAVIIVDGKETAEMPLEKDGEYVVENEYGRNVVAVKDGKVSVREADCPRQVCVRTGEKDKAGDTIICLAHRLVVEVRDGR